jgi:hypothetical protein
MQFPGDAALFSNGSTGVDEIDYFLSSVQHDNRVGYAVHSPDVKPFRTVW